MAVLLTLFQVIEVAGASFSLFCKSGFGAYFSGF